VVQLSNGGRGSTARTHTGGTGSWEYDSIDVGSFVTPTATVQVRFSVAGQTPTTRSRRRR